MDTPINILIVDDEPKNLTVLETILEDPSYRMVRAESADQALLALVVEEFGFDAHHSGDFRRNDANVHGHGLESR